MRRIRRSLHYVGKGHNSSLACFGLPPSSPFGEGTVDGYEKSFKLLPGLPLTDEIMINPVPTSIGHELCRELMTC